MVCIHQSSYAYMKISLNILYVIRHLWKPQANEKHSDISNWFQFYQILCYFPSSTNHLIMLSANRTIAFHGRSNFLSWHLMKMESSCSHNDNHVPEDKVVEPIWLYSGVVMDAGRISSRFSCLLQIACFRSWLPGPSLKCIKGSNFIFLLWTSLPWVNWRALSFYSIEIFWYIARYA